MKVDEREPCVRGGGSARTFQSDDLPLPVDPTRACAGDVTRGDVGRDRAAARHGVRAKAIPCRARWQRQTGHGSRRRPTLLRARCGVSNAKGRIRHTPPEEERSRQRGEEERRDRRERKVERGHGRGS